MILAFHNHREYELENSEGTENRFQNFIALYIQHMLCDTWDIEYVEC